MTNKVYVKRDYEVMRMGAEALDKRDYSVVTIVDDREVNGQYEIRVVDASSAPGSYGYWTRRTDLILLPENWRDAIAFEVAS